LKPFGLADFTESALLQGACGRTLTAAHPAPRIFGKLDNRSIQVYLKKISGLLRYIGVA